MPSNRLPDTVLPILLAGGEGTRLRPITADLPKPLIPVDGVPAICRILDTLAAHGVTRAVITVRYRADDIIGLLGDDYGGIRLFYSREDNPRGTAGGVHDAWVRYAAPGDTDALIISGDAVFTCDLAAFAAFHQEKCADAALLCVRVPDPGAFGTVISDPSGRITAFSEKPCAAETLSDTVNCGIYCMTRAFLEQIPADGSPDFGMDILPGALQAGKSLYAYESTDYWCDIGSFSDYLACSLDISAGRIPNAVTPRSRTTLPPYITDSSVGRDCFVPASASVRGSILFDRVIIGTGAAVTGSILCEGVHIGDGAVIEPGCVIGRNCTVGDGCRLPRGTRLEPDTVLSAQSSDARNAFDSGTVPEKYLSDLGYALSAGNAPIPEAAVIFARALAAFAEKTQSALFLCHAEDNPALCCLEALVCETLSCLPTASDQPYVSRADGVLPLSAARMPQIPLPDRVQGKPVFRAVFVRRGGTLRAVIFDDAGLHPTRRTERQLDACLCDAHSAADAQTTAPFPVTAAYPSVRKIPAAELLAAYVARYAVGRLQSQNGTPFSFSCGGTPEERLLAALLCAMGGEERLQASVHFSIPLPSEDCGDILCPLTVSDLRTAPVGTYSHWTLLSLLAKRRRDGDTAVPAFPTPRTPVPADMQIPLSLPLCALAEIPADLRYTGTPSLSDRAAGDSAVLARNYAAAEAEDAVLLARDIALLCSRTSRPIAALLQNGDHPLPSFRRHGFARSPADLTDGQTVCTSLSALTRDAGNGAFRPAVEGVILRRDDGCVRIVATRDHNFRIIADAYTTEAADALFRLAKNRLLTPDLSKGNP